MAVVANDLNVFNLPHNHMKRLVGEIEQQVSCSCINVNRGALFRMSPNDNLHTCMETSLAWHRLYISRCRGLSLSV